MVDPRILFGAIAPQFVLGLVFLYPSDGIGQAVDVEQTYEKVNPSVVLIEAYGSDRLPRGTGSGFFIESELIVTNHHVVDGASAILVGLEGEADRIPASVLRVDSRSDLALLRVTTATTRSPLVLSSVMPDIGHEVAVIGNPLGLESTLSTGIVSGVREFRGQPYLQISAPISPGSSGGPVTTLTGEVVGVATATLVGGQNLNFAVPVSAINSLRYRESSTVSAGGDPVEQAGDDAVDDSIEVPGVRRDYDRFEDVYTSSTLLAEESVGRGSRQVTWRVRLEKSRPGPEALVPVTTYGLEVFSIASFSLLDPGAEDLLVPPESIVAIVDGTNRLRFKRDSSELINDYGIRGRYSLDEISAQALIAASAIEMRIGSVVVTVDRYGLARMKSL